MRPSCPLARSPTLTWCWTTRHVRAHPYTRATRPCADLVSLGLRREAPRLCLCPVRGPGRRGRLHRQHEQRRALWPRAQGQRCEAERCGRRPPARCVARPCSSAGPRTLASLEPCVRAHRQSGSRKPTRTTRTRKRRLTAATPRVRRGPHEPMLYSWVLLSIHVLVWVCVGRFSVSRVGDRCKHS